MGDYPYGGFESARREPDPVASTPSQEDEELKKKLMEKDKEYNERKKREFLEREALGRQEKPKGKFDKLKQTINEYAEPVKNAGEKLGEKFTEAKENYEVAKQAREVGKFQAAEAKVSRASAIQKAAEIRKYGRELTEEERDRLVQFKIDKEQEKQERREKFKEKLANARVQITELGEKSQDNLKNIGGDMQIAKNPGLLIPSATSKLNPAGTPAAEAQGNVKDPLIEMFSLKGIGGLGGGDLAVKGQAQPQGADPLMSMYALPKGNVPTVPVQQGKGNQVGQVGQPAQRDSLMEMFSLKGFGNADDLFMKNGNFFGRQEQPVQSQPQKVENPNKKGKKQKK